jgi:hypothetical protein
MDTAALFKHLAGATNGIFIQTKGGPGIEDAIVSLGSKKNVVWYITITSVRPEIAASVEPYAPSSAERLALAKRLHDAGYLVVIAINPCVESWLTTGDMEELALRIKVIGIKNVCLEKLDISRNRMKLLSDKRKYAIGSGALAECFSERGRMYVRECTEYLVGQGFEVAKRGMPFRSKFFNNVRGALGKTFPVYHDFIEHCFDSYESGSEITFEEFADFICRDNFFYEKFPWNLREYLIRTGFKVWKDHQRVDNHRDLLNIMWNDKRCKISLQKHCLLHNTGKIDDSGNVVLFFDGSADLRTGKEVK